MCLSFAGYSNQVNLQFDFRIQQLLSPPPLFGWCSFLVYHMMCHFFTPNCILARMQADAAYKGMSDVFRKTVQREGFRGFYKGLFPNLLKVVPAASITYLVYESMKKSLDLD